MASIVLVALLAIGICWSTRLAIANAYYNIGTPEALERAAALNPYDAQYRSWLAELKQHQDRDAGRDLWTAVRLNPYHSSAWIRLGLDAELRADYPQAERFLLEAARIDKQFEPRAALANFYFRRENYPQFWQWTRLAFQMGYGDLSPLFQLCTQTGASPAEVLERALPENASVVRKYLA